MNNRNKLIFFTHQLWCNGLYIILIFFVWNFNLIAQNEQQEFQKFADKINIKITKALLNEKEEPNSAIEENLSFDEFIGLIKYDKNRQIASDINQIKLNISKNVKQIGLKESLKKFIYNSLSIIPNQDDTERGKTISALRTDLSHMIDNIGKETNSKNIKDINTSNQSIIAENNVAELPFYFWFLCIILFAICIYSLIKLVLLNKDYKHLKMRYNKFNDYQKLINQKYSEKINSISPQREIQVVSIPESEIERIKKIVFDDIRLSLRENEFLKERESTEYNSLSSLSSAENEPTSNYTVKFSEAPEREGHFDINFLSVNETPRSLYKIIFYTETNQMVFDILLNKFAIHRKAMDQPYNILKPACDYDEEPKPTDQQILKLDNSLGTLEMNNDKLIIVNKLKIKFG